MQNNKDRPIIVSAHKDNEWQDYFIADNEDELLYPLNMDSYYLHRLCEAGTTYCRGNGSELRFRYG